MMDHSVGVDHLRSGSSHCRGSRARPVNGRVGYLAKNYQELLFEFQKITEAEATAA
jgi:hypothetical protein